jgi:hypothetical protein
MCIVLQERRLGILGARPAQFAPHLPAHPQQENAAGEQQPDDCKQLNGDCGERQSQHSRRNDADQDRLASLRRRQACGREADNHRIVARKHQVDHDHLAESRQRFRR